jgi:nucleotide-binding universal stress UspA family protein
MKKIMMATDFSERSDRALRRVVLLARQFGAGVELIHVVDDDQPRLIVDSERADAEDLLQEMAATLRRVDGVDCRSRVILDVPFAGICGAVRESAPDLLVIGPHRRQVLRDVFVGTTAERTIRAVSCPTLMANATLAGSYRHILQTTDLSAESRDALRGFAALGIGQRTRSSLLHVGDAPALGLAFGYSLSKEDKEQYLADERGAAARILSDFVASADLGRIEPLIRHETTPPAQEILKAAAEQRADLIVVATHGRGGLSRHMIGSVTEQVLRNSPVDVLAIPPARDS